MIEVDAVSNVPPYALHCQCAIHIAELPQAEPVVVLRGGFREAVHEDVRRLCMELLLSKDDTKHMQNGLTMF